MGGLGLFSVKCSLYSHSVRVLAPVDEEDQSDPEETSAQLSRAEPLCPQQPRVLPGDAAASPSSGQDTPSPGTVPRPCSPCSLSVRVPELCCLGPSTWEVKADTHSMQNWNAQCIGP